MSSAPGWIVFDDTGRVVLMCEGADAREVAEEWRQRGYRVEPRGSADIHAA
jgi:hypothetical protein